MAANRRGPLEPIAEVESRRAGIGEEGSRLVQPPDLADLDAETPRGDTQTRESTMMSLKSPKFTLEMSNCPCTGVTLDKLIQPAILIVLMEGPLHGYRLVERLSEMPILGGQKPDASGVYRFLKTMESKRLVVSSWDTSRTGPAKKAYQITGSGRSCLRRWITTLDRYRDGITRLLEAARHAVAEYGPSQ